jgi:uncharacterized iron-regulated membrane protein
MTVARSLRSVVFWTHLCVAVAAGVVIIIMSATGVALAYQKPALAMVAARHHVVPPAGAVRLPLDSVVARIAVASDTAHATSITVNSDGALPLTVGLSDRRSLFVDPYTARVLGTDSAWRGFFQSVERWHRSLAVGAGTRSKAGTAITGACNLAFLFLVLSGFYLWWPRRWSRQAFTAVLFFRRGAQGRKRNWNWHHVLGFWAAPVLFLIVASGTFMSYALPQKLVARGFGIPTTPAAGGDRAAGRDGERSATVPGSRRRSERAPLQVANLDSLIVHAATNSAWQTIQLRLPQGGARTATATVAYGSTSRPDQRDQLTLDASTAAVVSTQGYKDYDPARKLRAWVRPIHTGEAGGLIGETIAALASGAAVVLGITGFLLAFSRFRSRRRSKARARDASVEMSFRGA